jgi:hypothetical protein
VPVRGGQARLGTAIAPPEGGFTAADDRFKA